ncbi:hypothetical protein ARMSODRAFT_1011248 [Armillaria solidipes]|uniref:Uncharacterized protein n=1 Tax=Armillaria solidipes TaxID=1076256 RepID=A0A2H3C6L2_9AGAR|nr:hypothetical protein ARMSODRAFT_1011248 [Armillaria solidipes]
MKRTTDDGDSTIEHHDDDDDYGGRWVYAEKRNGPYRRAGDVERDGGEKIGTPTPNDSNDEHALLGIEGGPEVATNAPEITDVRHFARQPLPAPPTTNIGLPRSSQSLHSSRSHASPLIWVGEHDPAACQSPRCPRRWPSHHHPDLTTPVLDVGESNDDVLSHLGPRRLHQNGHQQLPAPLSHPTDVLSYSSPRKLLASTYRDPILPSTIPALPAVDTQTHRAQYMGT